ncbi:hypothetical protein K458DRAFT_406101 [Lentithecium fluviatile CBS 122367]|uniref:Ecp2 effector protein domain-containing protein n=1 Tax=Lentithecium fluviatile CBS 122367 TaxID=1168545 RepID=A0A6G1IVH9_9PLEO|nr:hypothetical protein K458DRAFT_406101 [Lentithecium fluviatile CBS 122367]
MKITAALSILSSLLTLTGAFQADTDGLYEVAIGKDGEILGNGELLENITSTAPTLSRRAIPNPQTNCLGYGINGGNYQVAYDTINRWCDQGNRISPGRSVVAKAGASAAIICNFASGSQPCGSGENSQFNTLLDISCGSGAGWVWVGEWGKTFGRDTVNTVKCH